MDKIIDLEARVVGVTTVIAMASGIYAGYTSTHPIDECYNGLQLTNLPLLLGNSVVGALGNVGAYLLARRDYHQPDWKGHKYYFVETRDPILTGVGASLMGGVSFVGYILSNLAGQLMR